MLKQFGCHRCISLDQSPLECTCNTAHEEPRISLVGQWHNLFLIAMDLKHVCVLGLDHWVRVQDSEVEVYLSSHCSICLLKVLCWGPGMLSKGPS